MLNGDFQALGRIHEFVVGALSARRARAPIDDYSVDLGDARSVGDIFDWDGSYPEPDLPDDGRPRRYTNETTQIGLYGTMQFHATDALAIIGGARVNWWDGSDDRPLVGDFDYSFKGIVTPYLGFTYDINETYTAYGSITSIYKPQLAAGHRPQLSRPDLRLELRARRQGRPLRRRALRLGGGVPDRPEGRGGVRRLRDQPEQNALRYYELIDGTTTRGFELEAAGAINERWNASFGYTYAYSEDDDGNQVNTDTPRNTLKAATDYRIPGILDDRLTVGGAVRWQSAIDSIPWDGNLPNIEQDPYAVFDVNAQLRPDRDQSVLTLSVNNVLDEKYYASTGFYNSVIYGDGIGAELMLRARF